MNQETVCTKCFDYVPVGQIHRQIEDGNGTMCVIDVCPECNGRGALPAAFQGWQECPRCEAVGQQRHDAEVLR